MEKIASFKKDHLTMTEGLSLSMQDKDISTYDLRFIKPNSGKYMSPASMHTIEHLIATTTRNSKYKDHIIYFGPMGCRTGFYLLVRDLAFEQVKELLKDSIEKALQLDTVPGSEKSECGNYLEHSLSGAKKHLKKYFNNFKN